MAIFALIFLVQLASCRPKTDEQGEPVSAANKTTTGTTGAADPASSTVPSASQPAQIAHRAELEALGFHVFSEPQDLSAFTVPALNPAAGLPGELDSRGLSGKVTLLNFWATWCPPCKAELPSIQRLHELMNGSSFRVAAISVGEKKTTVEAFIASAGYSFPVYLDVQGALGQVYASQGIPTTYIIDKNGKAIAGIVGSREYDDPKLVAVLQAMAAE